MRLLVTLGPDTRPRLLEVATMVLLVCVAVLECWIPARRAARLNPMEALRGLQAG